MSAGRQSSGLLCFTMRDRMQPHAAVGSVTAERVPSELEPLTERILDRLPGPRPLWVAVWVGVPAVNAAVNVLLETGERSAVWEQDGTLVALNYVALSFAVAMTLWGSRRIAERLDSLRVGSSPAAREPRRTFRMVNATGAPLMLATATAGSFAAAAFVRGDIAAGLLRGATWLVLGVALWTFLWTYVFLQLGLDRIGRERLAPDAARVDPSLGLRPVGDVAFVGLWMLLVWLVPVLLTGLTDVVGVVLGLLVLAAGLCAFFLSLFRLHRQMVEVKARELAAARRLYAEAYEPVRLDPTLDALERQRSLLGAADALEKRAAAIHEWPIDEGTFARVLTITTSVVAMTVARLILNPLGL